MTLTIDRQELREAVEKQFGKSSKDIQLVKSDGVYFVEAKIYGRKWTYPLNINPKDDEKALTDENLASLMFTAYYELRNQLVKLQNCNL